MDEILHKQRHTDAHAHAHMHAYNYTEHMQNSICHTHTHIHTCTHTLTYTQTHTHTHTHAYAHTYTHTHANTHMQTHKHTHTHKHSHTHTHTHRHTHTHTQTFALSFSLSCTYTLSLSHARTHTNSNSKGIKVWEKARELFDSVGHRVTTPLHNLGLCYWKLARSYTSLDQLNEAIGMLEKSLECKKDTCDRQGQFDTCLELGNCYQNLNKYTEAIGFYEHCKAVAGDCGNQAEENRGIAIWNLGGCYYHKGESCKAIGLIKEALVILEKLGHAARGKLGGCHNSLGACHQSLGEYLEAIRQFKHACAIAENLGDLPGQRNALNNLGECYRSMMQLQQAIGVLQQAQEMTGVGTRTSQSTTRCNLACCYVSLGQFHRAVGIHEQDRAIMEEVGNRAGLGQALNNLGGCYIKLKRFDLAIGVLEQARVISEDVGDMNTLGSALGNIGNCYWFLLQIEKAIGFYDQGRVIMEEVGNQAGIGRALSNLAASYVELNMYQKATSFYTQAYVVAEKVGDRDGQGKYAHDLGWALMLQGDFLAAARTLAHSLTVHQSVERSVGSNDDNRVSLFEQQKTSYNKLQLVLLGQGVDVLGRIVVQDGLHRMAHSNAKLALGVASQSKARALSHRLGADGEFNARDHCGADRPFEEMCSMWWEDVQLMACSEGSSVRIVEYSFVSGCGKFDDSFAVWVLSGEGVLLHSHKASLKVLGSALGVERCTVADALELFRLAIDSKENGRGGSVHLLSAFEEIAHKFHDDINSADNMQSLISEILPELKKSIKTIPYDAERIAFLQDKAATWLTPMIIEECRDVHAWLDEHGHHAKMAIDWLKIRVHSWTYLCHIVPPSSQGPGDHLKGNKTVHDEVALHIWLENAATQKAKLDLWLEGLLTQEPIPTTGLIEAIKILKSKMFQWQDLEMVKSREQLQEIGVKGFKAIRHLSEKIARLFSEEHILRALYSLLIAPIAHVLLPDQTHSSSGSELLIIPHHDLFDVPWAALRDAQGLYLVESFTIRCAPSLRVARDAAMAVSVGTAANARLPAVVVGNPIPNSLGDNGPLPGAKKEALFVAKMLCNSVNAAVASEMVHSDDSLVSAKDVLIPRIVSKTQSAGFDGVRLLLEEGALKATVVSALQGAKLVHLACHADVRTNSLLLSHQEDGITGDLSMEEVQTHLKLAPGATVVLSACNTGRGVIMGEGVVGLSRGFLFAGAGAVVSSLWPVNDEYTKTLLSSYYTHFQKGSSSAQALRLSMCGMIRDDNIKHRAPYAWAAFLVTGANTSLV